MTFAIEQLALVASMFTLGVLHALEPAHGKVLLGGYFANHTERKRDVVLLSLLLTVFQALTMMVLALTLGFISYKLFANTLEHWVDALGGVMISSMGVLMLWHQRQHHKNQDECCQKAAHIDLHTHDTEGIVKPKHSFKGLLLMSFLWGLVPCPIALSALMTAWTHGTFSALVASVVMFSLGVGSIILTSGLCFLYGSHLIHHKLSQYEPLLNRLYNVVAVLFIALGIFFAIKHAISG